MIMADPRLEPKVRQGVTTEVVGNCGSSPAPLVDQTLEEARREAEIRTIRAVLEHTDGHKAQGAKILGISRKNLWEKMRDYGIE